MKKALKYTTIASVAAVIAMMIAATVTEKLESTQFAFDHFYHSPLFMVLWAAAGICSLLYFIADKGKKAPFTLGLHIAACVILLGALLTFLGGKTGTLKLRAGEAAAEYLDDDGNPQPLPFSVTLQKFTIERYPGSMAPSDFRSDILVESGGKTEERVISMNNIAKIDGYRLYQADYDEDLQGSILAVSHDPWGVGVTYTGYILLLLSMAGYFFQKDSAWKQALKRLSGTAALVAALLSAGSTAASAQDASGSVMLTVPGDVAGELGELCIYYHDRICPLQTMARDYSLKAYGKAGINGLSAEQVIAGWFVWYDSWKDVPLRIKDSERGTMKEREKQALPLKVASGEVFRIFPIAAGDGDPEWYGPADELPEGLGYGQWEFVRKSMSLFHDYAVDGDWDGARKLLGKIKEYQEKTASAVLPSPRKFNAEIIYNGISRPMVPFMASITLGLVLFVLFGIWLAKGRKPSSNLQTVLAVLAAVLLVYLTIVLGLRWYASGSGPFVGSYAIMMLMAWLSCIAMLCLYRKLPMIQPLGFLLAGFTMLMASLASANPRISNLMPVLQSPLLSIHVLSMMISYTLFGLVALNGIMGLFMPRKASSVLKDTGTVILFPALFLITFGTFLGAVWANISWGNYWAWDPKETWALITVMIYASLLGLDSLGIIRRPRTFHILTIFAFLSVLITYFGVNLILGGVHSYGG